jgi:hypothetical protein
MAVRRQKATTGRSLLQPKTHPRKKESCARSGEHPHANIQGLRIEEATEMNAGVADLQVIEALSAAAAARGTIANGAYRSQGIGTSDIGTGAAGRIRRTGIIARLVIVVGRIRGIGTIDRLVGVVGPNLGTD